MIQAERIKNLNEKDDTSGKFIIYWMQQSQRTHFNHALTYAIQQANSYKLPLLVYFGLTNTFPEANLRHYRFMLEGLKEIEEELKQQEIKFILRIESPFKGIQKLSDEAKMIIVDCGYTRIQQKWRSRVASQINCPLIQVESDVIVPVQTTSSKEEYGAYTIRPKISKHLELFIEDMPRYRIKNSSISYDFNKQPLDHIDSLLKTLSLNTSVAPSPRYHGGYSQAKNLLHIFLTKKLKYFESKRNNPASEVSSQLSPYLHFGQISPVQIALEALKQPYKEKTAFLEELIIRRELSMNFVYYNKQYDTLHCLPEWAYNSLADHAKDKRDYLYSLKELEQAQTHDRYWNAAQQEMVLTGKMHGYMRMYWGKKIIEWTQTPQQAFEYALLLNNKYELDGRDPNGYAGVAWCFGKHDRAWKERPIFGKIRYMKDKGLQRKGDLESYIKNIKQIKQNLSRNMS